MNKNIWKFIEIVGFDKLRLSIYTFFISLSTFLELSLFYKIGTISDVTSETANITDSLLLFVELPYLNFGLTLLSVTTLIVLKFLIVKFSGDIAFDFWRRAYQKYFKHILYLNEDIKRSNSEYITFLSSKLEVICQTISIPVLTAMNSVVYLAIVATILFWNIRYQIFSIGLVVFFFAFAVVWSTRGVFKKIAEIVEEEYTELNKSMQSAISSRMELFVHNSSKNIFAILAGRVDTLATQKAKTYRYSNLVKILRETTIYFTLATIIIVDLPSDLLNVGFLLVIFRSFPHLQALFSMWAHLKSISGLVSDGVAIISIEKNLTNNKILINFEKDNRFTFALCSDRFSSSSLSIEKGKVNIISGESGIGKSTIIKEILGIAPPVIIQNAELFDDHSYNQPRISYCGQRPFFLELSIRKIFQLSNNGEISDNEIWMALSMFELSERISNLDEVLKLDGSNFSGGEMARLSMAVGISRKPDIMVLDETLANLNMVLQKRSYLILRSSVETLIMITHDKNYLIGDELFLNIE